MTKQQAAKVLGHQSPDLLDESHGDGEFARLKRVGEVASARYGRERLRIRCLVAFMSGRYIEASLRLFVAWK